MISKPSSNIGHVGSKTRSQSKLKENLVNTLDAAFFQQLEILSECLSELYLGQVRIWVILAQKQGQ